MQRIVLAGLTGILVTAAVLAQAPKPQPATAPAPKPAAKQAAKPADQTGDLAQGFPGQGPRGA